MRHVKKHTSKQTKNIVKHARTSKVHEIPRVFPGTQLSHIHTDAQEQVISLPSVASGAQAKTGHELLQIQTSGQKKEPNRDA